MPAISLRLTETQLEELRAWAHDSRRSIQKEVVWRLFAAEAVGAPKVGPASNESRQPVEVPEGVEAALEEVEVEATEEVRRTTLRDDLTARFDTTPVDERWKTDQDWLARRAGKKK